MGFFNLSKRKKKADRLNSEKYLVRSQKSQMENEEPEPAPIPYNLYKLIIVSHYNKSKA